MKSDLPRDRWFRLNMPYAVVRVGSQEYQHWLPLNREYKPLGLSRTLHGWIDYEVYAREHPIAVLHFARDPRKLSVWIDQPTNPTPITERGMLWLYHDHPREAHIYYMRLRLLLEHKIT